MTAGFEVKGDTGCALEHTMTEGTPEAAITMSKRIPVLQDSCA